MSDGLAGGVGYENDGPPFSREEYARRLARVRELMTEDGLDLLYLTSPESICYMTGYRSVWYQAQSPKEWTSISGVAIHVDHEHLIQFDAPEDESVLQKTSIADRYLLFRGGDRTTAMVSEVQIEFLLAELGAAGWRGGTVGVERWSYRPVRPVAEALEAGFRGAGYRVADGTDVIRAARVSKSAPEIACVVEAARIADAGFRAAAAALSPGITELELYGEAIRAMCADGGELPAIVESVQAGMAAYQAGHGAASRRRIQPGEPVFLFLAGSYNRYHANIVRTLWLGEPPTEVVDAYAKTGGVFEVVRRAGASGTPWADFNRTIREYYRSIDAWDSPLGQIDGRDLNRGFVGGYELGLSMPPDWVGPAVYSIAEESPEGVIPDGFVANFVSSFPGATQTDTVVWEADRVRTLSELEPRLIVVDC